MKPRKLKRETKEVIILRIALLCILVVLIFLLATSCKKTELTHADTQTGYGGTVSVTVNSNYLRSALQVTNTTDNITVLTYNYGASYNGDCQYTKTFTAQANKKYKIYSYSTKNSIDSTLFMTDNKTVWNSVKIQFGTVNYQHKDSIGTGSWRICKNNYTLN